MSESMRQEHTADKMRTRIAKQVKRVFERVPLATRAQYYLVNYEGGLNSVAALREACEMASPDTTVVAVYLDVVPQPEPLDGDAPVHEMLAKAVLAGAIANAQMWNRSIETLILPCRVKGPALVSLAAERGNPVLFLGIDRRELAEQLNPFADYVLALAPCKVVLVGG